MEKPILVSACLAGIPCRYDGKSKPVPEIVELVESGKALPFCPECSSGLPTPRIPSEIVDNKVINKEGEDLTEAFELGADKTLAFCKDNNIKKAILKKNSPSCGKHNVYDGSFSGKLIKGKGITARKLMNNGIEVLDEDEYIKDWKIELRESIFNLTV